MFYIVEVQTNGTVGTALPTVVKETQIEAESAWHMIMGAAAISSAEKHGAIIFDDECFPIKYGYYEHKSEEEEEESE